MRRLSLPIVCMVAILAGVTSGLLCAEPTTQPHPTTQSNAVLCPAAEALQAKAMEIAPKCVMTTVGLVSEIDEQGRIGTASGSGVVVSADGLILTAGHVISKPGNALTIRFSDGRVVQGLAVGLDHAGDTGLARITNPAPAGGWEFSPIAPDDSAAVGEWVLATGNPGSIVLDRNPPLRIGRVTVHDSRKLQTNCALEPGDSGGPVFDLQGRVVGINSQIFAGGSNTHLKEYVSLHVPVSLFSTEWKDLLAGMNAHPDAVTARGGGGGLGRGRGLNGTAARFRDALNKLAAAKDPEVMKLLEDAQNGVPLTLTPELMNHLIQKAALLNPATQPTTGPSQLAAAPATRPTTAPGADGAITSADGLASATTRVPPEVGKTARQTVSMFTPALSAAGNCVVQIRAGSNPALLGTIVDPDGWIVTKSSDLPLYPVVVLPDGQTLPAKIIGDDRSTDIALLKVQVTGLTAAKFTDSAPLGSLLVAPTADSRQPAVGIVSNSPRPIPEKFSHFEGEQKLILGLGFTGTSPVIGMIAPGMPAEASGLMVGDQVVELDGQAVVDSSAFLSHMKLAKTGDTLTIKVLRDGKEMEFKPVLGEAKSSPETVSSIGETDNVASGKLSIRRTGFPMAIQTDAAIWGNQCGGPLINLSGETMGITIARYDRVCTFALPADLVQQTVAKIREKQK